MPFNFTAQQRDDLFQILETNDSARFSTAYGMVIDIIEQDQTQTLDDRERIVAFLKGAQNVNLNSGNSGDTILN